MTHHSTWWWIWRGFAGIAWVMVVAGILRGNWFWVWADVFVAAFCMHMSYGEK